MNAEILFAILISSSSAVILNCEFMLVDIGPVGIIYTCYTTSVTVIDQESIVVTNVTGTHLSSLNNENVGAIYVYNIQSLNRIPEKISEFFPNLKAFLWYFSNLTSISAHDLAQFPKLERVNLDGNRLVTITGNLFASNPQLQWISLNQNRIQNIGHDLLSNLRNLTVADFRANDCIDVLAITTQRIQELNALLPIICPPLDETTEVPTTTQLSTTTLPPSGYCSAGCSDQIDFVRAELSTEINELRNTVIQLNQVVASYEERFYEMERQLRELTANPCP